MAPIPNPEDMPTAQRHRIYGYRYDAAPHESRVRHHRHHVGHHHRRHHAAETAAVARPHARYAKGLTGAAPPSPATAHAEPHKAAPVAVAKLGPTKTAETPKAKAAVVNPPAKTAPAAKPAPTANANGGRITAAILALMLGAFVIIMALRQTMSGGRRRKPVSNYQAPVITPSAEEEKKAS